MPNLFIFKPHHCVWFLFFYVMTLTSCGSPEEQESTPIAIPQTPTPIGITQVPQTAVISVTNTAIPTFANTSTPTVILSSTPTSIPPTITPTITPIPTLSVQGEGVLLSELMASNGDCEIPCWWGITPGQTNAQAARDMFASQGIDDWVPSLRTYLMSLGYPHGDSPYYSGDVSMRFGVEDGLIQFIDVTGNRRQGEDGYLFTRDWQQYSLAEMLNFFGIPSYVTLTAEIPADAGPHYYKLGVSYASLGIEIHYIIAPLALNYGKEQICSDFEYVNFIRLILYPPDQAADIPVGIIPNSLDVYTSWETETGSNLEAFYEMFRDMNHPLCIEIGSNTS